MRKKALVTGASRGIGKAIALVLAQEGYDVVISYASKLDEALQTADDIKKCGGEAYVFQAYLQNHGAGKLLFDQAVEALGDLDLLVNNAGLTICEPLQEITEANLDLLLDLDFRNYILMMEYAVQYMMKKGHGGNIVNITSTRSQRAYPADGIYGGLKAGLNRAIQSFALDLAGTGIRINNVAPGAIRIRKNEEIKNMGLGLPETFWDDLGERIPLGRSGLPEDIAQTVAFLASEKASYITGVTLNVDGGLILPGMPELIPEGTAPGNWNIGMRSEK